MNLLFTDEAWEEYVYWQETNKTILKKINLLIKSQSSLDEAKRNSGK